MTEKTPFRILSEGIYTYVENKKDAALDFGGDSHAPHPFFELYAFRKKSVQTEPNYGGRQKRRCVI
jgi:hypothetical protein